MAWQRFLLTSAALLFAGVAPALSQQQSPGGKTAPEATPTPAVISPEKTPVISGGISSPSVTPSPNKEPRNLKELEQQIEKLPPDRRKRILKNAERWKDLPPEQRDHIKFLSRQYKRRVKEGVDDALASSGLTLDAGEREKFEGVYKKYRRDLERQLRQEMEARRQELLPGMIKKVVAEYKTLPAETPAPAPAPSASPKGP